MSDLDFFPFDLPPGGPFLAFYVPFACVVLALGFLGRRLAARALDRLNTHSPPKSGLSDASATVHPYRENIPAASRARSGLAIGAIPTSEEQYAIAFLNGGPRAVTDLLIVQAIGDGWLRQSDPVFGSYVIDRNTRPELDILRDFHTALSRRDPALSAGSIRESAALTVSTHLPNIRKELMSAGLIRAPYKRWIWVCALLFITFCLEVVGTLRINILAAQNRPFGNLFMAMLVTFVAGLVLARIGKNESTLKEPYLQWLSAATLSLQADVRNGRRLDPSDVGLALATGGAGLIGGVGAFSVLTPLLVPLAMERVAVRGWLGSTFSNDGWSGSSSSSCSASSCSSSSSGGGSGCGGGGCGGGGGCS